MDYYGGSCLHSERCKVIGKFKSCLACHCIKLSQMANELSSEDVSMLIRQYKVIESVINEDPKAAIRVRLGLVQQVLRGVSCFKIYLH